MALPREQILRVLDANINRAREGLRVCEDLVRFCLAAPTAKKPGGRRWRVHIQRLRALRHALGR